MDCSFSSQSDYFTSHLVWVIFEFSYIRRVLYCQPSCDKDAKCTSTKKEININNKENETNVYLCADVYTHTGTHTHYCYEFAKEESVSTMKLLCNVGYIIYSQSVVTLRFPICQFPITSKISKFLLISEGKRTMTSGPSRPPFCSFNDH